MKTGKGSLAKPGNEHRIWVNLWGGESGMEESGKRFLRNLELRPGQTEVQPVLVKSLDVIGILSQLTVGYDNPEPDEGWQLEHVRSSDVNLNELWSSYNGKYFLDYCNSPTDDDASAVLLQ